MLTLADTDWTQVRGIHEYYPSKIWGGRVRCLRRRRRGFLPLLRGWGPGGPRTRRDPDHHHPGRVPRRAGGNGEVMGSSPVRVGVGVGASTCPQVLNLCRVLILSQ